METKDKIKYHFDSKSYCIVFRKVAKEVLEKKDGYIVDYSDNFILMQEVYDFNILGFLVIPIQTITKIRFNNSDKYYNKIMNLEGLTNKIENKHKINLTNWETIFKSIKKLGFNVIVENENPEKKSFEIGPITKITKSFVYVRFISPIGYFEKDSTKINFDLITITKFNDRYVNIISKYIRQRKPKSLKTAT